MLLTAVACGLGVIATVSAGCKLAYDFARLSLHVSRLDDDDEFEAEMYRHISVGLPCYDGSTLAGVIGELAEEGHDINGVREQLRSEKPDDALWYKYKTPQVNRPGILIPANPRPLRLFPKFAAACVVELRAKFGALERSNANMLLVQATYLKLCREHRVRHPDVARHRQIVLNEFFRDTQDAQFAYARYNAPRWLLWLRQYEQPQAGVMAC